MITWPQRKKCKLLGWENSGFDQFYRFQENNIDCLLEIDNQIFKPQILDRYTLYIYVQLHIMI